VILKAKNDVSGPLSLVDVCVEGLLLLFRHECFYCNISLWNQLVANYTVSFYLHLQNFKFR
jgi:hypothetical protein